MSVKVLTSTILVVLFANLTLGQRPSYAGSRPPNGHRDKYLPTRNATETELSNRFGGETLANGVSQRPPQGVPVVSAEPVFVPIQTIQPASTAPPLSNRFGSATNNNQIGANRIPLDAHGDQQLIDHLNQIPIDNRPFWFINYQAIEAQRNNSVNNNFGPIASRGSFMGK